MPDGQAGLLKLLAWLSPAFPVGSFSYSHGLEAAIGRNLVENATGLSEWLSDLIIHGSAWNDAVLLADAHRITNTGGADARSKIVSDPPLAGRPEGGRLTTQQASESGKLLDLCHLAEAMAGSQERHMETMLQGGAFMKAVSAWTGDTSTLPEHCPYPVAVGATAGSLDVPLHATLAAFLQAFASNQLQAAIRLSLIGQTDAMKLLSALEPLISETADRAAMSSLDDLGSATMMAEIAAMQHEVQMTRLFRT